MTECLNFFKDWSQKLPYVSNVAYTDRPLTVMAVVHRCFTQIGSSHLCVTDNCTPSTFRHQTFAPPNDIFVTLISYVVNGACMTATTA